MSTVEMLNAAFMADPNAIHALVCNRVPCNAQLAANLFVVVDSPPVLPEGHYQAGLLGVLNGVLAANGLPPVATRWSEELGEDGRRRLLGFCEYRPAS